MFSEKVLVFLGCALQAQSALAVFWSCADDSECSAMVDSVCLYGGCYCLPGKQSVLGGTLCADVAPYISSQCIEDFQCSRLFTTFQCRRSDVSDHAGNCFCSPGNHYFRGRCWPSTELGQTCTRDEECHWIINDPFSMRCNGVCECAEGYYLRQRGECRRIGAAVGDGCVLDEDCQFEGGACFLGDFTCYNRNAGEPTALAKRTIEPTAQVSPTNSTQRDLLARNHGAICSPQPCSEPFQCSSFGVCLCPVGYYPDPTETICLAELGSPVTSPNQCVGLFTEVRDGICSCQANFFFDEDMRTCVKVSRLITDSCLTDANCHTFGVHARCGPPQQWGIRSCECDLEYTVWDANRSMCRVFATVGEVCEVDSDCLAGDMEIQCVADSEGQHRCACPEGYITHEGLCLTLGLNLGDTCQLSMECTGTANTICSGGVCSCDAGYQPVGDVCAPALGGSCAVDADCSIADTSCSQDTGTCQCDQGFVEFQELCWPRVDGHQAPCNVSEQCVAVLGAGASCADGLCACADDHHYRDGSCWAHTRLFQTCTRTSQCFLAEDSERVHCRNSICQCTFDYPYSEELGTCRSSAASIIGNSIIIATSIFYLFSR